MVIERKAIPTKLRVGDPVIVIAGGNKEKRPLKGQVGKVVRFVGDRRDRVVVAGVNLRPKTIRPRTVGEEIRRVMRECPVHISNVQYYVESLRRPVRLKVVVVDGKKKRAYRSPETGELVTL